MADSEATVKYLELCSQITSSYLDNNLEPLERVYRIWNALYFLRCWRIWIQSRDNKHTLSENFVSRNLYLCVEINSHALIYLIRSIRNSQQSYLFVPTKFSSQPCEFLFRQMRSMGTVNFTKINFTMNELLHMIGRVELINKLVYSRKEIKFPRINPGINMTNNMEQIESKHVMPSDQQILDAIQRAQRDAINSSNKFGMNATESSVTNVDVSLDESLSAACRRKEEANAENCSNDYLDDDELYDDANVLEQLLDVNITTSISNTRTERSTETGAGAGAHPLEDENPSESIYEQFDIEFNERITEEQSECRYNQSEKNGFIEIINSDGSISNVRKSTFVWSLLENKSKLSSDRLKRVQGPSSNTEPKRKKQKTVDSEASKKNSEQIIFKATDIEVGEWAVFKVNDENLDKNDVINCQFIEKNCLVGIILGFKNIGERGQGIQYKYRHAKTPLDGDFKSNLQVLGAWYTCNESGTLSAVENKNKIKIHMQNYIATMKTAITVKNVQDNSKLSYQLPCELSQFCAKILDHVSH